ncbi:MAG TPA: sugar phosphate isomerase/epimerase family protein [Bryobacteraceae bacterium]|nr:sugar phosphate isomerase/epimerase family protein [Bryobacteraceae bacterium]
MFWADGDPVRTVEQLTSLGVRCGQMGIPGDLDLKCAPEWSRALAAASFRVYTVFAAFDGESYADIPAVQSTVGFTPRATREEREKRMRAVIDFAAQIGAPGVATHVGFVPDNVRDPDFIAVREMVRRIADEAGHRNLTFALETGQETAEVLLEFIHDVNRDNVGINFDPANMILYGTGDPIEALGLVGEHVLSVHCKDGDAPAGENALGEEKPLGQGSVGMERFLAALRHAGYSGPLFIEREARDPEQRLRDIRAGLELLRRLSV